MPQDQDDIKGADAMKQAPTPGPLMVGDYAVRLEDHPLVKAGDVHRVTEMFRGGYLGFARPVGGEWNPSGWRKCDADGWMPWSGGENPVPGQRVQVKWRADRGEIGSKSYPSDDLGWRDPTIIAFRLAPTAPVEASGAELHPKTAALVDRFAAELKSKLAKAEAKYGYAADWLKPDWQDELTESLAEHIQKGDPRDVAAYCAFAWHHGWSTSDAAEHFAPNFHFQTNRDQIAKCIRRAVGDAWIGDAQAEVAAEAVLSLRPQPSGETREGPTKAEILGVVRQYCAPAWCSVDRLTDALHALSARPAPVASGDQHSSGEGK